MQYKAKRNTKLYRITPFQLAHEKKNKNKANWSIRGNIFISGKHTGSIQDRIEPEYWGVHSHQLYHYLDYTFRICVMKNEMKVYKFTDKSEIGVFNTGLKSKIEKKSLFLLCKHNTHIKKNPKWAIPTENIDQVNTWLMTADELTKNYGILSDDLPKQMIYTKDINNSKYQKHWRCNINWESILAKILTGKAKKTIIETLKTKGVKIDAKCIKQDLARKFEDATRQTIKKLLNGESGYAVPGLFIDFKKEDFWFQLMMYIKVWYKNEDYTFVVVLNANPNTRQYTFSDLLSLKQGYYNGRYIQKLEDFWKPKELYVNRRTFGLSVDLKADKIKRKYDSDSTPTEKQEITISPNISPITTPTTTPLLRPQQIDDRSDTADTQISLSPSPPSSNFSLSQSDGYNNNNNNNKKVNTLMNDFHFETNFQSYFDQQTQQIQQMTVTRFVDIKANSMTELVTMAQSNKYIKTIYSLQNNVYVILSRDNGTITNIMNSN